MHDRMHADPGGVGQLLTRHLPGVPPVPQLSGINHHEAPSRVVLVLRRSPWSCHDAMLSVMMIFCVLPDPGNRDLAAGELYTEDFERVDPLALGSLGQNLLINP